MLGVRFRRPAPGPSPGDPPLASCTDRRLDLVALHGDAGRGGAAEALARCGAPTHARLVAAYAARRSPAPHSRDDSRSSAASSACSSEGRVAAGRARRARRLGARASCSAASPRSSASRRAPSASSSSCAACSRRCATRRSRPGRRGPGRRLLRPPADGARLPPPPRQNAPIAAGRTAGPGLAASPTDAERLSAVADAQASTDRRCPMLWMHSRWDSNATTMRPSRPASRRGDGAATAHAAPAAGTSPGCAGDWRRCQGRRDRRGAWLGPRGDLLVSANLTDLEGGKASFGACASRAATTAGPSGLSPIGPSAGAVPAGRGGARSAPSSQTGARASRRASSTGAKARSCWRRIEGTLRDQPAAIEWRLRAAPPTTARRRPEAQPARRAGAAVRCSGRRRPPSPRR